LTVRAAVGPLEERMVFVIGSPRSGTTFTARAIGSCPGFVDLGEVAPLKAAIPELTRLDPAEAAARIRRLLTTARRLGLTGGLRAVEQTPETVFVAHAVALAFPQARFVHLVRDGRDVACSLLERGWLRAQRTGSDDAGLALGAHSRFWVEPGREVEFSAASDVRRAAWAWRRYAEAAAAGGPLLEVRYERLASDHVAVAAELADFLDVSAEPLVEALAAAHDLSVGRYRQELEPAQIREIEAEAGALLRRLGYLQ
jgi:hypothetical protein